MYNRRLVRLFAAASLSQVGLYYHPDLHILASTPHRNHLCLLCPLSLRISIVSIRLETSHHIVEQQCRDQSRPQQASLAFTLSHQEIFPINTRLSILLLTPFLLYLKYTLRQTLLQLDVATV